MPKTIMLAAAIAAATAAIAPSGAPAQPIHHRHHGLDYICTGTPPQYDPQDLNQMRASVDAASRLALAIRQREYLASCHPLRHRSRHHLG